MQSSKIVVADIVRKYDNPIGELVQRACMYSSDINLLCDDRRINAKSIMGIMAVSPRKGMEMEIVTDGDDEEAAVESMKAFLLCM